MKISIKKPVGLSGKGKREHNEDFIFPLPDQGSQNDHLFIVCDGVGGARKGEIASSLVANGFADYFTSNPPGPVVSQDYLDAGLEKVEAEFSEYIHEHPECRGMATTITMLHFDEGGALFVWAGDSRINHFRNGEILYKTNDHSLVNELFIQGHITEDQIATHPQRNVILRAIKGSDDRTELDFSRTMDVEPGDRFMLCSDGILESFSDQELSALFKEKDNLGQISIALKQKCEEHSNDNYSAYLIEVEKGEANTENGKKSGGLLTKILAAVLILAIGYGVLQLMRPSKIEEEAMSYLSVINQAIEEKEYQKAVEYANKISALDQEELDRKILNQSEMLKDSAKKMIEEIKALHSKAGSTEAEAKALRMENFFSLRELLEINLELFEKDINDKSLPAKIDSIKTEIEKFSSQERVGFLMDKGCEIIKSGDLEGGSELFTEAKKLAKDNELEREINIQDEISNCQALME